jgi:hypothetical protein
MTDSWCRGVVRSCLKVPPIAALALLLGCTQPPTPVQRISIDPDSVKTLNLRNDKGEWWGSPLITDTDVIRRCVAELNGLSCEPYRGPDEQGLRAEAILVVEAKDGSRVAAFAFMPNVCIRMRMGASKLRAVRYERTPTIGKLVSYGQYECARYEVLRVSDHVHWSDSLKMERAQSILRFIRQIRRDLNPPEPSSPQELRELARYLPEAQLDRLDEFPDMLAK